MSEITVLPVVPGSGIGIESPFDVLRQVRGDGSQFWSARELQPYMGYAKWQDFQNAIERAKISAANGGHDSEALFVQVVQVMDGGNLGPQQRIDYELCRFACYLTFLNGDPRKPQVADAQAYFAIRTRQAELAQAAGFEIPKTLPGALRLAADQVERAELAESRVAALDAKVAADAPKVAYVDRYVADEDLLSVRTVAANNNVGERWLRDLLIGRDWIYVQTESRWSETQGCHQIRRRYSAYADKRGYFRPAQAHQAPCFKGEAMHTLKITPAGAEAIARLIASAVAA